MKNTEKLTKRQQEVLKTIENFIGANGVPPTRSELATQLGLKSITAADEHIKTLAKKGVIRISPGISRGIHLNSSTDSLPVIGNVAAGIPIESAENIEGYQKLDLTSFAAVPDYLLRVQGDSMTNAGILDGDLLVVKKSRDAKNGQIVVVLIDDEVTVKRFFRNGDKVTLQSENTNYPPIHIDPAQHYFRIEGIYLGVIRAKVEI